MRVLVVEPERRPEVREIDSSLKSMQSIVGGPIQAIYPFEDSAAIVCCEMAEANEMPLNRVIYGEDGETVLSIIRGAFFVCDAPAWSEHFLSLSAEQLVRYSSLFAVPQVLIQLNNHILVIVH